jgi:hypothetical protein
MQAENSDVAFNPHLFHGVDVAVINPLVLGMVEVKFPLPGTVNVRINSCPSPFPDGSQAELWNT